MKNFLEEHMIDTIGMTDIGNGRPSNQDAYLLRWNGWFEERRDRKPLYCRSIETVV